jgi:N-methylhydantoinase B
VVFLPFSRGTGTLNPIRLEIYRHLLTALTEEMGGALRRAAYSPNIKERRDYSCALFDAEARVVAMGDHMPVHLGAMPMSVRAALDMVGPLGDGDIAVLNDPFAGGTHLPDITLVAPVHMEGAVVAYLAVRAHHADVGGMAPGSMPLAREIFQEGLRIPPVLLVRRGERDESLWRLILANVRTPEERAGDLAAQFAALNAGTARLLEIVRRRGVAETRAAMQALIAYADLLVRRGIERIPDGTYKAEDVLDDDGFGNGPLRIVVRMEVTADRLEFDFAGTATQTVGGVNAVASITHSCVRYATRCVVEALLEQPLPAGGGDMAAVTISLPARSLVNAAPPASVAAGNVETSQRIADVLLRVFGAALPELIPAQSQGTMNNVAIGGMDPRSGTPFAYYETMCGGMGAGAQSDGMSGVHVHMTNSLNTPVEALEHAYPLRVLRYELRRGSGGAGARRGGDGVRRDIELLANATVSLLTERRTSAPAGGAGGADGARGENVLIRNGEESALPAKATFDAQAGDIISIRSPGGGGWGTAAARGMDAP